MKSLESSFKKTRLGLGILLVSCLTMFNAVNAQTEKSTAKTSELSFESTVIDFGEISQHANGEKTFTFTNSGEAPLLISNVKTSCGCTIADFPKQPILAGESGEIKVSYDTKRIGAFSKTITVFSNATEPQLNLKIKGEVLKNSL